MNYVSFNKIPRILIFIFILLVTLILARCNFINDVKPTATNGYLDLSSWNLDTDGNIKLDGEWEFYWNELLSPENFDTATNLKAHLIEIPVAWNKAESFDLTAKGYATFRLNIKTSDSDKNKILALNIPVITSSYKIWVNDEELTEVGEVATKKDEATQYVKKNSIIFKHDSNELILTIQVSNYSYSVGGIIQSIRFGIDENILSERDVNLIIQMIILGLNFSIGIYHFILFLKNRKNTSYGWFSLLTIAISLFNLIIQNNMYIFSPKWFLSGPGSRTMIFVICLLYISWMGFIKRVFPEEMRDSLFYIIKKVSIAQFILAVILPLELLSSYVIYLQAIAGGVAYISILTIYKAIKNKREGAYLIFIGCLVVLGISINDILYSKYIINTLYLSDIGLSLMLVLQTIFLSTKLSKEYKSLESFSQNFLNLDEYKDDIIDFSNLKNNDIILNLKKIDLAPIIDVVLTIVGNIRNSNKINIISKLHQESIFINADEGRVQQILYNIIGNALKYTDEGFVTIETKLKDGFVIVSISDTGIGITKQKFSSIFKSIEKVDYSISSEYGGTGLGLSISKNLVELHGGEIWGDSKLGQGTTFHFSIPAYKADIEANNISNKSCKGNYKIKRYSDEKYVPGYAQLLINSFTPDTDARILIVDDEPTNIQKLYSYLRLSNYNVEVSTSGEDALNKIDKNDNKYDIILLDIMMPKMSGYEVCENIRKTYSKYELPIILMSAENHPDYIITGFKVGANDYITKPFEKIESLARIKTIVSLSKSFAKTKKQMQENENLVKEIFHTQEEIIIMLGDIAESKSNESGLHIKRVAKYSELIAEIYGLSKSEIELIRLASPMHDVGKIAISDSILNKPGKLTYDEFQQMKLHSQIGFDMLKSSNRELMKTAAIIAQQHHEKYNGSGYPHGLKEKDIHIFGRIVAVADVFDALIQDRVYKNAWKLDEIIDFFEKEKGNHFDPVLIEIFLKNLDKFLQIKNDLDIKPY